MREPSQDAPSLGVMLTILVPLAVVVGIILVLNPS